MARRDAATKQIPDQFRRQAIDSFSSAASGRRCRGASLCSHKMSAVLALGGTRRLGIAHGQVQVWDVSPDVRRFPIWKPEFAIARGVERWRVPSLHERLLLQQTNWVLESPKVGAHVMYDSKSGFHVSTARLEVARTSRQRAREFRARRAGVDCHDVGRTAVMEEIVDGAFVPPSHDVGHNRGLELGVDVHGENTGVEVASYGGPPDRFRYTLGSCKQFDQI